MIGSFKTSGYASTGMASTNVDTRDAGGAGLACAAEGRREATILRHEKTLEPVCIHALQITIQCLDVTRQRCP